MNAGLGTLTDLKTHLLAQALRSRPDWDNTLLAIGRGVAEQFDKYCDRKFCRLDNDQEIISADRANFSLGRLPVESVATIELKLNEVEGFQAIPANLCYIVENKSGIVTFTNSVDLGPDYGQVRFTFTGGYWFDDTENGKGQRPDGAAMLPNDVKLAWLQQCDHVWKLKDKIGQQVAEEPEGKTALIDAKLTPQVAEILARYIRYQFV